MHGNILTQIDDTLERALKRACLIPQRPMPPEPGRGEVGTLMHSGIVPPHPRRPEHTEDLPLNTHCLVRQTKPHSPIFHEPLIALPQEDQC